MRKNTLRKLVVVGAVGAALVAGLGVAGAAGGDDASGESAADAPEPAQHGRSFASAMQAWATCVSDAAVGQPDAAAAFDPFEACGELPSPSDFEIGPPGEDDGDAPALPERAANGQAFAAAMQDWAGCVSDAAAGRAGDHEGRFDPFEACGELPRPADFGIGRPETAGPPDGAPQGDAAPAGTVETPVGDVSTGPPEGTPPAASTGSGRAAPTPWGAAGPPPGVPAGPPAGTPGGRP